MANVIRGKVYVVGDNIDTDQIIPAQYLVYNPADDEERKFFGRYAMAGVPDAQAGLPQGGVQFTEEDRFDSDFRIIVAGGNFGCGSSREHAPIALGAAGIKAVIAESFARIFFRNCIATGELYPIETPAPLREKLRTGDEVEIDLDAATLKGPGLTQTLRPLGEVKKVVSAGGLFAYARTTGLVAAGRDA